MKTLRILIASLGVLTFGMAHAQQAAPPEGSPARSQATGDATSGVAAWYGRKFTGRKTASGKRFDPNAMTAAHRSLPFGTRVKVTNLKNQRSVLLTITDRGPTSQDRIIDVTQAAARKLGFLRAGLAEVSLEVVGR